MKPVQEPLTNVLIKVRKQASEEDKNKVDEMLNDLVETINSNITTRQASKP